jgi:hypothetical protein
MWCLNACYSEVLRFATINRVQVKVYMQFSRIFPHHILLCLNYLGSFYIRLVGSEANLSSTIRVLNR